MNIGKPIKINVNNQMIDEFGELNTKLQSIFSKYTQGFILIIC